MSTKDYVGELRALIGARPVNFVGAAGLVRSGAGEVLLVRRVGGTHWGLPAGISELGEALPDTLRRELREETGLEVEAAELIEMLSPDRLRRTSNDSGGFPESFERSEWKKIRDRGDGNSGR